MNVQNYLDIKKDIQEKLLDLLKSEQSDYAIDLTEFINFLDSHRIREDENEFRALLHLIHFVSVNHHRSSNFFEKIDKILLSFKIEFQKYFDNDEIYKFFKQNKRVLLFLFEKEIIKCDDYIINDILTESYGSFQYFFYPEVKNFLNYSKQQEIENKLLSIDSNIFENFNQKRFIGENETYICELIRNDSIDEFDIFKSKTNYSLSSKIKTSIFETNVFIYKSENDLSLIEYAAFFGSIQIFNYLRFNNVELTPSLWSCAIHSNNPEMIHILERCHVEPPNNSYIIALNYAIYCHHNEMVENIGNSRDKSKCFEINNIYSL